MIHFIEEINMRLWILVMVVSFTPWLVQAELPLGEVPPVIELSGDKGGRINGESWSSSELQGKVFVLFYADPDEADLNNDASEAIKAEDFDKQKYGSVAVINMAATWMPNFAIQMKLESKQKDYPTTTYVKDMEKILVEQWGLADDSNDVLIFDCEGKVVFSVDGQLNPSQIEEMLQTIRKNLRKSQDSAASSFRAATARASARSFSGSPAWALTQCQLTWCS